jgi:hypothetical protein
MLAVTVALTLLAAGCGGDDGSPAGSTAAETAPAATSDPTEIEAIESKRDGTLSRDEFTERADDVCTRHEHGMVEAFTALRRPGTDLRTFADALAEAGGAITDLTAELDAVPLPRDDRDAAAYIDDLYASAMIIETARAAAAQDDRLGVDEAVTSFGALADETARVGERLGFDECGKAGA